MTSVRFSPPSVTHWSEISLQKLCKTSAACKTFQSCQFGFCEINHFKNLPPRNRPTTSVQIGLIHSQLFVGNSTLQCKEQRIWKREGEEPPPLYVIHKCSQSLCFSALCFSSSQTQITFVPVYLFSMTSSACAHRNLQESRGQTSDTRCLAPGASCSHGVALQCTCFLFRLQRRE